MGIFPEGKDSRGDHNLGRSVDVRFKGPPGTPSSYNHHSHHRDNVTAPHGRPNLRSRLHCCHAQEGGPRRPQGHVVVALDKINIFESISWTIICVKVSSVKCILRFGVSKYLIPFFPRLFSDLLQSCIKRLSMTLPRTGKLRENQFNPLTPNETYSGRTAPLTSKRFILYIY